MQLKCHFKKKLNLRIWFRNVAWLVQFVIDALKVACGTLIDKLVPFLAFQISLLWSHRTPSSLSLITTLVVLLLFTCNSHLTVVMPNLSQFKWLITLQIPIFIYQSSSMNQCFSVSAWFIHLFSSLVSSPVCLRKKHTTTKSKNNLASVKQVP